MGARLPIDPEALAALCRRHRIRKLSLFGSQLEGTARPDSDVDLLSAAVVEIRYGAQCLARLPVAWQEVRDE